MNLSEEDLKILKWIDSKAVVYPHEVATYMWPDDENRNLRVASHLKTLESSDLIVRRGVKKSYIVTTKKGEDVVEADRIKSGGDPFDEGDPFASTDDVNYPPA